MTRRAAAAAWTAVALDVALCAAGLVLTVTGGGTGETGPLVMTTVAALGLACAVVGALIAPREPANPIAWLLCGFGTFIASAVFLNGLSEVADPTRGVGRFSAWTGNWAPYAALFPIAIFVPLLFPDGRLPTSRWRSVEWCAIAGTALSVAGTATAPGSLGADFGRATNPVGIDHGVARALQLTGFTAAAGAFVAAIAAVVVRYRSGDELRRQQIRLLVAAAAATACCTATGEIARSLGAAAVRDVLGVVGVLAIPVAIAVAMRRYRLYDVDRLISRSLTYALLTLVLGAAYASFVLAGQAALASVAGGSNVVIAASTLLVAALFLPVRARVQRLVDRRFYRRRYDAVRTLESFSARLRRELEVDSLRTDLQRVVEETVQPSHVSIWLRPRPSRNDPVTAVP